MANVAKINGYDVKDAEARGDIADIQQDLSTAQGDITTLQGDVSDTKADLGDITALTTTVKTSAVNAINEVDSHADANTINIGNLAALNTVDKSDIVSAINEVERNASYGISNNTYNFAPTFSDETSYAVGDYVTYNGVLYKCTTAHTAGVWVAGHFTQATLGGELNEIVPSDASASNKLATNNAIWGYWINFINDNSKSYIHKDVATSYSIKPKFIRLTVSIHESFGNAVSVSEYLLALNFTPYNNTDYRGVTPVLLGGIHVVDGITNFDVLSYLGATVGWDENGIYINNTSNVFQIKSLVESPYGMSYHP